MIDNPPALLISMLITIAHRARSMIARSCKRVLLTFLGILQHLSCKHKIRHAYIFESLEAAPPVTLATRNCDSSCIQTQHTATLQTSSTCLKLNSMAVAKQHFLCHMEIIPPLLF